MEPDFERLFSRRRFGMKPGLEVTRAMLERLDRPHEGMGIVHVAGTNGKGAVSAMLAGVLRAAGYPVGLFTSPHLLRFNERFVIDGAAVSDRELTVAAAEVEEIAEELEAGGSPAATFFECATVMAFRLFHLRGVRLAVLETGLGGRLDATNVVHPLVSVITGIGLDHTAWLGNRLAEVAREKGGIIKPGRPVVLGSMPEEALKTLRAIAAQRDAPCFEAAQWTRVERLGGDWEGQSIRLSSDSRDLGKIVLPLAAPVQCENAALCLAVCDLLQDRVGIPVDDAAVRRGLESVVWPGRFQRVKTDPPVIVDGAHNPSAAEALAAGLKCLCRGKPVAGVLGMCSDKDVRGGLRRLSPALKRLWTVPMNSPRAMPAPELAACAESAGISAEIGAGLETVLPEAEAWAVREQGVVLVFGSLFLAGEALHYYGVAGANGARKDPNELYGPRPDLPEDGFHERIGRKPPGNGAAQGGTR